jgi:hypothetical protein
MSENSYFGDGRGASNTLWVFRVENGTSCIVRTLSARYWGIFYHWQQKPKQKGKGIYCAWKEEECTRCPREERFWKGFASVEIWEEQRQHWAPWVLEITENAELALRGLYDRGQVWQFARPKQQTKKARPVEARLLETRDKKTFPQAYEILPTLLRLFHRESMYLDTPNPMPLPTRVQMSPGDGPDKTKLNGHSTAPPFKGSVMEAYKRRCQALDAAGEVNDEQATSDNGEH